MGIYLQNFTAKSADIFTKILAKSLAFFVFLYILDGLFRAVFIIKFGVLEQHLGAVESLQIIQAFINGSRYFGQIVGVLGLIVFVLLLLSEWGRVRFIFRRIYCIFVAFVICAICFVNIANMGFFEIYGDVFNGNLLGLIFDDRGAIFRTAMGGQYNLSLKIIAFLISSFVFLKIIGRIFNAIDSIKGSRISAVLLFFIFAFSSLFAINGTFGLKGISLGANIKPVTNSFLRQISTGAFRDLYIVFIGYKRISHSKFSDYTAESPFLTAQNFTGKNLQGEVDLLDILRKSVDNPQGSDISHIFYINAESMSEWHFDSIFDELELSSELKRLVSEKNAFKAEVFLQNAGSTIKSLDVQISGLLQTDIPLSLLNINELKTAPAVIAKELGYSGSFFYGGSGTWQKLDSYVTTQGFSEILFSTHIIANAKEQGFKEPYANAWGAYDNYLFDFIKDRITKKSQQNPNYKSFNMIMTTSNHPPYDVPLERFNAPMQRIQNFIDSHKDLHHKPITARLLAHIWWQDKIIAKFIAEMSEAFPNSLFVITGDHYDREYPFSPASMKVQQSVPLIVYAPALRFETLQNVGSHIDITPTIINLVAPHKFQYHSFGKPMLKNVSKNAPKNIAKNIAKNASKNALESQDFHKADSKNALDSAKISPKVQNLAKISQDFTRENALDSTALGFVAVANDRFIYDGFKIEYFSDTKAPNDENLAFLSFMQLKRAKALSWWILKNGYKIPADSEDYRIYE